MDQKILSPVIFVLIAFLGISCAGGSLKASRSDLSAVDHSLQQSKLRADISAMNIGLKIPDSGALFKIEVPFSSAVLISLSSTGEIFAADGKRGVYYSKDDGLNWSKSPIEAQCRQFLPIASEQILAVCQEELLSYRSGVWTKIPLPKGLHKTLTPQQVAAGFQKPDMIYLAAHGEDDFNGLWRSSDSGHSWDKTESITLIEDDGEVKKITTVDEQIIDFAIHPGNSEFVIAIMTYGIFLSVDGGENFVQSGLLQKRPILKNHL